MNNNHLLFSGTSHPEFSKLVSKHLNTKLSEAEISEFSNGEINITVTNSVRNKHCYIIQPTSSSKFNSPNDNLIELFIFIDALRRGSAKSVTVIMPYYGYERQDRKDYSRAPISATVVSKCLESLNIDRLMVFDLHAGQIQGFFSNKIPVDNLYAEPYFIKYIQEYILSKTNISDLVIVSPDEGAVKRAVRIASHLQCAAATIFKERTEPNIVDKMTLMGHVNNKIAIIVDDIIDTAGTACKAAEVLKEKGAKEIYMLACHGLLSGSAYEQIENSCFTNVIVTNTVPIIKKSSKIKIIDVSWLCAESIIRQIKGQSIQELYPNNFNKYNICFI